MQKYVAAVLAAIVIAVTGAAGAATVKKFTISISASAGGSFQQESPAGLGLVQAKTQKVLPGESREFFVTPKTGYHLENVVVDGESLGEIESWLFEDIQENHKISAKFAINTYTIYADLDTDGGTISSQGESTVKYNTSKTYTIKAAKNYIIDTVMIDGEEIQGPFKSTYSYTFKKIAADHEIWASFAEKETAEALFNKGVEALNNQDFEGANDNFRKALTIDPNHKKANFAAAILRGLMLAENPKVQDVFEKWGETAPAVADMFYAASPVGNPAAGVTAAFKEATAGGQKGAALSASQKQDLSFLKTFAAAASKVRKGTRTAARSAQLSVPDTAPTIAEMQQVIDTTIIPELEAIAAMLAKAESSDFSFVITPEMQGNIYGEEIVIGSAEVYAADAAVNLLISLLKITTAYNFDIYDYDQNGVASDYDLIRQDPLASFNTQTFFTLKSDGKTKMSASLQSLKKAMSKAETAYNLVKAGKSSALDLSRLSDSTRAELERFFQKANAILAGQTTVAVDSKQIVVDATKFFTSPLTRTDLPTLGYDVAPNKALSVKYGKATAAEKPVFDWDGNQVVDEYGQPVYEPVSSEIVPKSDFPDYTLNGIFPQNSATNNIAGFNGLLPVLDGKVLKTADLQVYSDDYSEVSFAAGSSVIYLMNGYRYDYETTSGTVQLSTINPATGAVAPYGSVSTGNGYPVALAFAGDSLYLLAHTSQYDQVNDVWQTVESIYRLNGTGNEMTLSDPVYSLPETQTESWSSLSSDGKDLYVVTSMWDETWNEVSEVTKVVLAPEVAATSLFTIDGVGEFAVNGTTIYTADWLISKRSADGSITASYVQPLDFDLMLNGYFYAIRDSKLVKFAATPAGGAAPAGN